MRQILHVYALLIDHDLLFSVLVQCFNNSRWSFPLEQVNEPDGKPHKTGCLHQAFAQLGYGSITLTDKLAISIALLLGQVLGKAPGAVTRIIYAELYQCRIRVSGMQTQ